MPKYYDEDGNLVEGVLSPEEIQALKEKADKAAEFEERNRKLEEKDLNFRRLKGLTEEEKKAAQEKLKADLEAQMSEREKFLLDEIETLKSKVVDRETNEKMTLAQKKDAEIAAYAGADESLKQKIQFHFDRLGTPANEEQIKTQAEEAFALANREIERGNPVNPLNQYVPGVQSGAWNTAETKRTNFADTPEGQAFAKNLGLGDISLPNKGEQK